MQEANLGTFSHMIVRAHALLRDDENMLAAARRGARFVLADEFQDANFAQVTDSPAAHRAGAEHFCRGRSGSGHLPFPGRVECGIRIISQLFPATKFVALEKNHRSTTPVLRSAFALIEKNPPVFAKARAKFHTAVLRWSRRAIENAGDGAQAGGRCMWWCSRARMRKGRKCVATFAIRKRNRDANGRILRCFIVRIPTATIWSVSWRKRTSRS